MRKRYSHGCASMASASKPTNGDGPNPTDRWRLLGRNFFNRPPDVVAPLLLGKLLVRRAGREVLAGRIVETEAYLGQNDAAAHAASGQTPRNAVLFGPPGFAYVYRIYGLHNCLNVSCLPAGDAGCVLFRALEPVLGLATMRRNRGLPVGAAIPSITAGPGRLCAALQVTRDACNALDMTAPGSPLVLMDDGFEGTDVVRDVRVGIRKDAHLPLRYFLRDSRCVSARR
jgi:DNA-3-methyladenine glycosylase